MTEKGWEIKNEHYMITLNCPCGYSGIVTYGKFDFKVLGKDKEGFLYFKCLKCGRHLQYDPLSGHIKTKKGIMSLLFGKFN